MESSPESSRKSSPTRSSKRPPPAGGNSLWDGGATSTTKSWLAGNRTGSPTATSPTRRTDSGSSSRPDTGLRIGISTIATPYGSPKMALPMRFCPSNGWQLTRLKRTTRHSNGRNLRSLSSGITDNRSLLSTRNIGWNLDMIEGIDAVNLELKLRFAFIMVAI